MEAAYLKSISGCFQFNWVIKMNILLNQKFFLVSSEESLLVVVTLTLVLFNFFFLFTVTNFSEVIKITNRKTIVDQNKYHKKIN